MLKEWLNKNLSFTEKFLSVEAIVGTDDVHTFNVALIVKKGKGFKVDRSYIGVEAEFILRFAGTDFPLILTISGKGIVVKNLGRTDALDVGLNQVFPNANADDFLFQSAVIDEQTYISVIRIGIFDQVFTELRNQNLRVVQAFIGPIAIGTIRHEITPQLSILNTAVHQLSFSEENNISIKPVDSDKSFSYHHDQQELNPTLLQPFGSFLAYYRKNKIFSIPDHDGLRHFVQDEKYRLRFESVARVGLVILLVLLIINRLLSYEFTRQYAELEVRQALLTGESQESSELKKELEIKKQLALAAGLNRSLPASFYSDQIGALIPEDISLTELSVFPASSAKQGKPGFDFQSISVTGKTLESSSINQLVEDLGHLEWTEKASIAKITDEGGILSFIILIRLK